MFIVTYCFQNERYYSCSYLLKEEEDKKRVKEDEAKSIKKISKFHTQLDNTCTNISCMLYVRSLLLLITHF